MRFDPDSFVPEKRKSCARTCILVPNKEYDPVLLSETATTRCCRRAT